MRRQLPNKRGKLIFKSQSPDKFLPFVTLGRNHLVSQLAKELTFYFVKQSLSISFFIKRVTKFEFQSQIKVISDPNTCFFNYILS